MTDYSMIYERHNHNHTITHTIYTINLQPQQQHTHTHTYTHTHIHTHTHTREEKAIVFETDKLNTVVKEMGRLLILNQPLPPRLLRDLPTDALAEQKKLLEKSKLPPLILPAGGRCYYAENVPREECLVGKGYTENRCTYVCMYVCTYERTNE